MKKVRRAHLWIGLIASVLIFIEAFTGLLMNEPWLVGQQSENRGVFLNGQGFNGNGNFQQGQLNQGQGNQGNSSMDQGQGNSGNLQSQGGFRRNGQFGAGKNGFSGNGSFRGLRQNQNTFLGIIRQLHEGRIGNTNIKWLMDLAALALMFLTGSGIFMSIKILRAESKRKNRSAE